MASDERCNAGEFLPQRLNFGPNHISLAWNGQPTVMDGVVEDIVAKNVAPELSPTLLMVLSCVGLRGGYRNALAICCLP
jgi:hypothetical protein